MCGHLVHVKFLELACFCPKLAKNVAKRYKRNKYEVLHAKMAAHPLKMTFESTRKQLAFRSLERLGCLIAICLRSSSGRRPSTI